MSHVSEFGGYQRLASLGKGSMGQVYAAQHLETGERAVIKVLSDTLVEPHQVERFKREIRAALQLDHPGLIQSYTAGQDENGSWYYVMEFIEGNTVKTELLRGPMSEDWALEILRQVAEALDYAWGFNLIHRDIKPENIMITGDQQVKLCDMGLAKSLDTQNDLTASGTVLGTPQYMSPEQARGEDLDFRSDIYSLGVTLYRMVTGFSPFEGKDPLSVITALLSQAPTPPRDHNPKLSDGVCYLIAQMMNRNPNGRYNSYRALQEDINRAKVERPTMAEESGRVRILSQTEARDARYRFSHVPNDQDYLFGKIALRNKLANQRDLEQMLNLQEEAAHHGAMITLADVMLAEGLLSPQAAAKICEARCQYEQERARDLFLKSALDNQFVTAEQVAECHALGESQGRGPVPTMIERGYVTPKQRRVIRCNQQMIRRQEEDRLFIQVAVANNFVSPNQAQRCQVIQGNGVVMGTYRDLGGIMVERELMKHLHKTVILRAIRRHQLTGRPISVLIAGQRIQLGQSDSSMVNPNI